MKFYSITAEQAGITGPGTVFDTDSASGRKIPTALNFCFQFFPVDDIVYCPWSVNMVTDRIVAALDRAHFTGYQVADAQTSVYEDYLHLWKKKPSELPHFNWLKITGKAFKDDFGLPEKGHLVVSERALELLKKFSITKMEITEAVPPK